MPIKLPAGLPAGEILTSENIDVSYYSDSDTADTDTDLKTVKIALLNLMPTKIATETQIARLLSHSPFTVELTLLQTATHTPSNVSPEHMKAFYHTFDEVRDRDFDGLIITGAPVENLSFEEVDYWNELCGIMEWSKKSVRSTLHICWAAQAALYYHYGIPKYPLDKKMFGIFRHRVTAPNHPIVRGFDEEFAAPHSRHTEIRREDIERRPELEILAESDEAGVYIVSSRETEESNGMLFVTGHSEYDSNTLATEYFRDVNRGLDIDLPKNYFPNDDPSTPPKNLWRAHANLLFLNFMSVCTDKHSRRSASADGQYRLTLA